MGDDINKVPPAMISQIIHKESKESHEALFPFPEEWSKGGFEEKYKEIKSSMKFREGSDELDIDLEDLDNSTFEEITVTSVDLNKHFQDLPQSSPNFSATLIYPERMIRNIAIFAMLLIASRFGVLLLLNFILTLVSFYLSIRYAQMYREQKEQDNTQRPTMRQTSRPSLFNDFNESSTVSFNQKNLNQLDKKNQAPNKNIAFVIPVNKE